jgi:hypothetical protein
MTVAHGTATAPSRQAVCLSRGSTNDVGRGSASAWRADRLIRRSTVVFCAAISHLVPQTPIRRHVCRLSGESTR